MVLVELTDEKEFLKLLSRCAVKYQANVGPEFVFQDPDDNDIFRVVIESINMEIQLDSSLVADDAVYESDDRPLKYKEFEQRLKDIGFQVLMGFIAIKDPPCEVSHLDE